MSARAGVTRSAFLGLASLAMLRESPAMAQQAGKTFRVGILSPRTLAYDRPFLDAFRHTMLGLGYQEGKNLEIVYRGDAATPLPVLAADLVRAKPDAIVAAGNLAIGAAKRATSFIPIVMAENEDPVGSGFVASLARPGGNITGMTTMNLELLGKWLQLLKELVPRLRRAAVIRNPSNPGNLTEWREAQSMARTTGIAVVAVDIRSSDQIDAALKTIPHLGVDAIMVLGSAVTANNAARIVRLVRARRLPAVYTPGAFTAAGGLMSYGASRVEIWSRLAIYVDRIFKGAKPAELPVEQPTTFELVVNLKTARSLGITVPQSILLQATQVIR